MANQRKVYCPNCGTEISYVKPEGAGVYLIDEYPQCPRCNAYIYLADTEQYDLVKQIHITMYNC